MIRLAPGAKAVRAFILGQTGRISAVVLATTLGLSACSPDEPSRSTVDGGPSADSTLDNAAGAGQPGVGANANERPNIVLIVADDLGFGDLGYNGSEIPTPNIDALAAQGMRMTNFYSSLACSPTRAMLMSGMDNHLAGLGVMNAPIREDHQDQPGYLGYLNFRVASLASLLSDAGYDTYMTGKWHLGSEVDTGPRARGFKRSFVSLDGAAHLGPWDWRGPQPANYRDGDELVQVDEDFYSTRFYTERMIEYIEQDRPEDRPFFAYLAYTAPHWPLQAPAESIARFQGDYDDGYEALYAARLARQRALGIASEQTPAIDNARFNPRWQDLSPEDQAFAARRMEIYAAMVSDLDTYIGEVIDYLRTIDEFDNSLIVFISDNGAESGRRDLTPNIAEHVGIEYDHSLENLGSATSYVMYGRNWASASATPFHRHKATAFEGGVHVPAFAHFPGQIEPGTSNAAIATVADLLPTFLDIADATHPGTRYRDRDVLPPQGTSLMPLWRGESTTVRDDEQVFGFELYGHRSVRRGNWKLVWDRALPEEERRWQLYNLAADPFEQNDLSEDDPTQFQSMLNAWDQYAADSGVIF